MESINLYFVLADMEKYLIRRAMQYEDNNKNLAARRLGVARTNLVMKMKKLNIESEFPESKFIGFKTKKKVELPVVSKFQEELIDEPTIASAIEDIKLQSDKILSKTEKEVEFEFE